MKKVILFFFLLAIFNSFGQTLSKYKIDDYVSVNMPNDLELSNASGQKTIKGILGDGIVMITKTIQKDTTTTLEYKEDLMRYYDGIQKGFLKGSKGKLTKREIIKIKGLTFLKMNCLVAINGEQKNWDVLTLFLKNYTYTIVFIHSLNDDNNFLSKEQEIISSIQFKTGLGFQDQLNHYEDSSRAAQMGKIFGIVLFYGLIIGLALYFIFKARKNK